MVFLGRVGASWARLGASLGVLGRLYGGGFEASCERPGSCLERLGGLEAAWGALGCLGLHKSFLNQ